MCREGARNRVSACLVWIKKTVGAKTNCPKPTWLFSCAPVTITDDKTPSYKTKTTYHKTPFRTPGDKGGDKPSIRGGRQGRE